MPAGNYKPFHLSGTTNAGVASPITVKPNKTALRMIIQNNDATNPMDISFDGSGWFTLVAKIPYSFDVLFQQFYVRSANAVVWSAILSVG